MTKDKNEGYRLGFQYRDNREQNYAKMLNRKLSSSAFSRLEQIYDCPLCIAAAFIVIGQLLIVFAQAVLVQGFNRFGNVPVNGLAAILQDTVVYRLAHQNVFERILDLGDRALLIDQRVVL